MTEDHDKYQILFVDDEVQILDGLRDLLRKQRKQWDMVFALGGAAALAELKNRRFDVVVSDMRMPLMDGATLLAEVKRHYPACFRIILSGHAEQEAIVKALPVAHQFLSKPCDANQLRIVIERACELTRLLQDQGIRDVIGKLDKLPSVPRTYFELNQAAARSDVTLVELATIVEQDPAMSAKVLQVVNSAYFSVAQSITSVQHAISYLGVDLLKALALVVHAFGIASAADVPGFSLETLQEHSLLAGRLAKRVIPDPKLLGDVFTASVIHDVGKIVLALGIPDRYAEVVRRVRDERRPSQDVEREMLGVSHAQVGAYLLGSWGLPVSIVEAVAYHHEPGLVGGGDLRVLSAVHIADALMEAATCTNTRATPCGELDLAFVERQGMTASLSVWSTYAADLALT